MSSMQKNQCKCEVLRNMFFSSNKNIVSGAFVMCRELFLVKMSAVTNMINVLHLDVRVCSVFSVLRFTYTLRC